MDQGKAKQASIEEEGKGEIDEADETEEVRQEDSDAASGISDKDNVSGVFN